MDFSKTRSHTVNTGGLIFKKKNVDSKIESLND